MALAILRSRGQSGLEAFEVSVEVHIAGGLPGFSLCGLPTTAVRESKDRVRAALQTVGLPVPPRRITVHLGPADIPKDGSHFDLPIALGVIAAEHKSHWCTDEYEFVGELALSGELRGSSGFLPAVLAARAANRTLIMPAEAAHEAALVENNTVRTATHLRDVIDHLDGGQELTSVSVDLPHDNLIAPLDLADVEGQTMAKRALVIAAGGGHNLLLFGPPGTGKSMLAERLPSILPPLDNDERLAVAALHSLAGQVIARHSAPPFRAPHHSSPARALLGGGARPRPGEVSLAHKGVLYLDEFPEFSRPALEALREPLETGRITLSRVLATTSYPAEFQLVAAMNPCPCGYLDDPERCTCAPGQIARYTARVSGPIIDRIDLHVQVERANIRAIRPRKSAESPRLRELVSSVQALQKARAGCLNARLDTEKLQRTLMLHKDAARLLEACGQRWQMSPRAVTRTLKTSRTIADIESSPSVEQRHVAEALQLRCLDRRRSNAGAIT